MDDLLALLFNAIVISGAIVVAVVGLFSAPWQLLLLVLLGGLWTTRWLMQENQRRTLADEFPFSVDPRLSSRR
jgi:Flp pilus assembly protein TadB